MGVKVPITAEMDDGRHLKTMADQRDFAAVEAQEIDPVSQRTTWVRYVAYSALRRTKAYGGTWEQFNTLDCVEAVDGDAEEPAGADGGLDPGRPAPGAGS